MTRAIVTLITPRPRAPQLLPEALHLRQFGLEVAEGTHRPASVPTRRSLLVALIGAALAGTALAVAGPPLSHLDPRVCRNADEVALLAAFRQLNPAEKQAALTMLRALAERRPVALPVMPASPDAELLALTASFEDTARQYNGLWHWRVSGGHLEAASYVEDDDARDSAAAPFEERMSDLAQQITDRPPTTLAGCQAIARCLVLSAGDLRDAVHDGEASTDRLGFSDTEWLLTFALLRGLGAAAIADECCASGAMRFVAEGAA